jgi:transposase
VKDISMIGLDTSKSVFEICACDATGAVVNRARLKRGQLVDWFSKRETCTVVLEACGASYHWARCFEKQGHTVKLVPPNALSKYKTGRHKNDARDAEALACAGRDPGLRPVPVKSEEQQADHMTVKVRALLVRQATQSANALRGLLGEFGLVAPRGCKGLEDLIGRIETAAIELPGTALEALAALAKHWRRLMAEIVRLTQDINLRARSDERSVRLMGIPGVGPIIAATLLAKIGDATRFESGRDLAAWIGLVPRQNATAGKTTLRSITKAGDQDLRWLLVQGAASVLLRAKAHPSCVEPWIADIVRRKPFKVAAVALAARIARTAWALLAHDDVYRPRRGAKCAAKTLAAA